MNHPQIWAGMNIGMMKQQWVLNIIHPSMLGSRAKNQFFSGGKIGFLYQWLVSLKFVNIRRWRGSS